MMRDTTHSRHSTHTAHTALSTHDAEPLLRLTGLHCGYGPVPVVRDVTLAVHEGEICALVGANGAGKSTLLSTVSGLLKPTTGTVEFDGTDLTGARAETVSTRGLLHVPEGRRLFRGLTVRENLDLGLWRRKLNPAQERGQLEWVLGLFPFLAERLGARAEVLSGGEQQMLVIGQALMGRPRMLMIDEPSIGLAPVIIDRVFDAVRELRDAGLTVLLVDQTVERTLDLADRGFVMRAGRIVAEGPAARLRDGPRIRQAYLGTLAPTD